MSRAVRLFRFWLGRHLMHIGLRAMPPGRVRQEITYALGEWARSRHNEMVGRDAIAQAESRRKG